MRRRQLGERLQLRTLQKNMSQTPNGFTILASLELVKAISISRCAMDPYLQIRSVIFPFRSSVLHALMSNLVNYY